MWRTFITITYRDHATGGLITNRVEFSQLAASQVQAASAGYRRHREILIAAREVLGRRDAQGKFSAVVQWEALEQARQSGRLPLAALPPRPANATDLFVAFEYEVDAFNNFTNVVQVYRESEIERRVVEDPPGPAAQILMLRKAGEKLAREVRSFRRRGLGDELKILKGATTIIH